MSCWAAFSLPLAAWALGICAGPALAWGDEGHEVIALVARQHLNAKAAAEVTRLLALDKEPLTMRDGGRTSDSFERQATWADYYRDAQRGGGRTPAQIHSYSWHFADIEISGGSLETACFSFPGLGPGVRASQGPDPDCVVNKIEQFSAELADPATPDAEKLLALKFLLHFVGDLHQPLHAADQRDRGGNDKQATVGGKPMALHRHWDQTFVERIGAAPGQPHPEAVAAALRPPTPLEKAQWLGTPAPRAWALESYRLAQSHVYGALPAPHTVNGRPVYALDPRYVDDAVAAVADQLNKAGHRLAAVINSALGR